MRVLYVLNATIPNGGATKAFLSLLNQCRLYGIQPFIVMPDKDGIYRELQQQGLSVYVLPYRNCTYSYTRTLKERLLFLPRMIAKIAVNHIAAGKLATFIRENKIDVVHTNSSVVNIGFRAAQKTDIPHIYHIREYGDLDFGMHYFPTKEVLLNQLKGKDCYTICITKDIRRYYQLADSSHSRVIYDGVFSQLAEMPVATDKDYFLYAGRIQLGKGLDLLLTAYRLYTQTAVSPLKLLVAGSYDETPYVHQQIDFIKENQLSAQVTILGEVDNILSLMQHARAIIIPSRNEGFGFCMPEAMQQGCLVIAHNTSGTKEQLDNALQMTGQEIALRYDSIEELTQLLADVAERPVSYYSTMTECAFKVVNQLYTRETHAQKVFQFYNDILHDKNL